MIAVHHVQTDCVKMHGHGRRDCDIFFAIAEVDQGSGVVASARNRVNWCFHLAPSTDRPM